MAGIDFFTLEEAYELLEKKLLIKKHSLQLKELEQTEQFSEIKSRINKSSRMYGNPYRQLIREVKDILAGEWNLDDFETAEMGAAFMLGCIVHDVVFHPYWTIDIDPKDVVFCPSDGGEIYIRHSTEELLLERALTYGDDSYIKGLRKVLDRVERRWRLEKEKEKHDDEPDVPADEAPGHGDVIVKVTNEGQ